MTIWFFIIIIGIICLTGGIFLIHYLTRNKLILELKKLMADEEILYLGDDEFIGIKIINCSKFLFLMENNVFCLNQINIDKISQNIQKYLESDIKSFFINCLNMTIEKYCNNDNKSMWITRYRGNQYMDMVDIDIPIKIDIIDIDIPIKRIGKVIFNGDPIGLSKNQLRFLIKIKSNH